MAKRLSEEMTLLQQAAAELKERMRLVRQKEHHRELLAKFLKAHPLLTRKDVMEVAQTMPGGSKRDDPVTSANVNRVGRAIREGREKASLTTEQLSKKLGCHWTSVHKWERGDGMPGPALRAKLNKLLNVSVEGLLKNGSAAH